jgi:CheY-like chemotaxis protein
MSSHVLVAEDDRDIRNMLKLVLSREGLAVVGAPDGKRALALASAEPPRLVISDLRMPRMDGLELITRLRTMEATANTPIVLFTAYVKTDERVRAAARLPRVEVLEKPELRPLLDTVARLLSA